MRKLISNTLGFTGLFVVLGLLALVPMIKYGAWLIYALLVPLGWISGQPPVPPEFG